MRQRRPSRWVFGLALRFAAGAFRLTGCGATKVVVVTPPPERDRLLAELLNGLAEHLHQRGTFITSQTNRLRERGLIYKDPNPDDRRGVLLRLAPPGRALIEEMLPLIASLNDRIFEGLDLEAGLADQGRLSC